jgi:hypothetical protein
MVKELNNQRLIDTQHNEALMNRYKCSLSKCPNGIGKLGGWCVIVDDVHLKLMPAQMTTWSIAINDDLADIENAPPGLFKALMPAKTGTLNPLRVSATAPTTKVPETPASAPAPPAAVAPIPATPYPHYPYSLPPPPPPSPAAYPFYNPYGMHGHYPYMPLHPGLPPPLPPHYQYSPHISARAARQAQCEPEPESHFERSSSVLSQGEDPVEKMKEYFGSMKRRTPSQEADLTAALKEFLRTNQSFDTIKDITDEEFVLWNIEPGLKNQIRQGVTKFDKHYKKKGR